MAELSPEFSQRLKKAIKKAGLTQVSFAEKTGVRPGSISKYCNGGVPEWHILVRIAQALGLSVDYLLTGKEFGADATRAHGVVAADPKHQALLKDALEILQAQDVPGDYDKLLAASIKTYKTTVDAHRKSKSPRRKVMNG